MPLLFVSFETLFPLGLSCITVRLDWKFGSKKSGQLLPRVKVSRLAGCCRWQPSYDGSVKAEMGETLFQLNYFAYRHYTKKILLIHMGQLVVQYALKACVKIHSVLVWSCCCRLQCYIQCWKVWVQRCDHTVWFLLSTIHLTPACWVLAHISSSWYKAIFRQCSCAADTCINCYKHNVNTLVMRDQKCSNIVLDTLDKISNHTLLHYF